ncbi:MAG: hypothetical protein ACK4WK_04775, partial [Anaerolineae bacterium]
MHTEQEILAGIDQMRHRLERLETKVDRIHAILEGLLLIVPPVVLTTPEGNQRLFRPVRPVS